MTNFSFIKVRALLLVMLFLAGCGSPSEDYCIETSNPYMRSYGVDIPAAMQPTPANKSTYWVKSPFYLYGNSQKLLIKNMGVNLCDIARDAQCPTPQSYIVSTDLVRNIPLSGMEIGDTLFLSLGPAHKKAFNCSIADNDILVHPGGSESCAYESQNSGSCKYEFELSNRGNSLVNKVYIGARNSPAAQWLPGKLKVYGSAGAHEEQFFDSLGAKKTAICAAVSRCATGTAFNPSFSVEDGPAPYSTAPPCCDDPDIRVREKCKELLMREHPEVNEFCGRTCATNNSSSASLNNCYITKLSAGVCVGPNQSLASALAAGASSGTCGSGLTKESFNYLPFLKGMLKYSDGTSEDLIEFSPAISSLKGLILDSVDYTLTKPGGTLELSMPTSSSILHVLFGGGIKGSYNIYLNRKCRGQRKLYYYVTAEGVDVRPGDPGTVMIPLEGDETAFSIPAGANGAVYFGILDDNYNDNTGSYYISGNQETTPNRYTSKAVVAIRNSILKILYNKKVIFDADGQFSIDTSNLLVAFDGGAVGNISHGIVNSGLNNIVRAALALAIALLGFSFIFGLSRSPQADVLILLIKIGIVLSIFSPKAWDFLTNQLLALVISGSSQLMSVFSSPLAGGYEFAFMDTIIGRFLEGTTWMQLLSILSSGFVGLFTFLIIFWGIFNLFTTLFKISLTYIISIVLLALLLCLSPIFISFILFKVTKESFDNWVKALFQVAMQPIIMFSVISFVSELMGYFINTMLSFDICNQCALQSSIPLIGDILCIFNTVMPDYYDPNISPSEWARGSGMTNNSEPIIDQETFAGMPVSISLLLGFVIMSNAVVLLVDVASSLAMSILGAIIGNIGDVSQRTFNLGAKTLGLDEETSKKRRDSIERKRQGNMGEGSRTKSDDEKEQAKVKRKDVVQNN